MVGWLAENPESHVVQHRAEHGAVTLDVQAPTTIVILTVKGKASTEECGRERENGREVGEGSEGETERGREGKREGGSVGRSRGEEVVREGVSRMRILYGFSG